MSKYLHMITPLYVAIADDQTMSRHVLIEAIERNADDIRFCIVADDGLELIEKLRRAEIFPNVCMLDINMPVLNGYETLTAIRKEWPKLKVLAFSMHDHELAVLNMFRRGATGFVLKYGHPNIVIDALCNMHYNGYYHSELVNRTINRDDILPQINDRELEFLKLCCLDLNYFQIAEKMGLSKRTIEWYRDQLFKKLHVETRSGLALLAMQIGLAPLATSH